MKRKNLCFWSVNFLTLTILIPALAGQVHRSALRPLAATKSLANMKAADVSSTPLRNYSNLPLSFEPNVGQSYSQVQFLARGEGYTLFLTETEAVLAFSGTRRVTSGPRCFAPSRHARRNCRNRNRTASNPSAVRLQFQGTNPNSKTIGLNPLSGKVNYFTGNDPHKWHTGVPTFEQVKYKDLYPGVDLIFYGNPHGLEYDFTVEPGADPEQISIRVVAASNLRIDTEGNLHAISKSGQIEFHKPVIYEGEAEASHAVTGGYFARADGSIGFTIGKHDPSKLLTIDPAVYYSTYLGGNNDGEVTGIAVDSTGNTYVGGITYATDFPITSTAFSQGPPDPNWGAAFVTEINSTGTALIYSTYITGNGGADPYDLAIDSANPPNIFVTGWTCSSNFPTTSTGYLPTLVPTTCQTSGAGGTGFVTKLNPTLSGSNQLVYSTYLGGNGTDWGNSLRVDASGNIYVSGSTSSSNFPVTQTAFQTTLKWTGGTGTEFGNGFVTRLDPSRSGTASLVYSTYLGGSGDTTVTPMYGDEADDLGVDSVGDVYVVGFTDSRDFPTTATAYLRTPPASIGNGGYAAFVAKINTNAAGAASLIYSTYFGGSTGSSNKGDTFNGVALGPNNLVYTGGQTFSPDFPVTAGSFRAAPPTNLPAAVFSVFDTSQTGSNSLAYSTFLSGSTGAPFFYWSNDLYAVAADSTGNAYLTGRTNSSDFPITQGAFQTTLAGSASWENCFVTELMPSGNGSADLVYSTFLGGSSVSGGEGDSGANITIDSANNAYVGGYAESTNFPVTTGAFQTTYKGPDYDAFISKLSMTPKIVAMPNIASLSASSGATGSNVTITGSNFGIKQQTSTVTFGTAVALIISWSSTSIVAQVPNVLTAGAVQVAVTTRVGTSNTQAFTVAGGPNITTVLPPSGGAGTQVTITGSGFGASQGSGLIYLGTSPASIVSWSNTQIIATVAAGSRTGVARVSQGGSWSNTVVFSVPPTCP